MNFIDLPAHYPMHLKLPVIAGEDPVHKAALEALYDFANEVDNYQPINRPRVTAEQVVAGGASGLASVLYDPEDEFLVSQEPHPKAIEHIYQQIKNVEEDAQKHGLAVVKDKNTLDGCLETNQPFLTHCMEGGHGLSGDPENVARLADKGVLYIILAHLRFMGLAGCAKGLPCKTDFWQKLINQAQDPNVGLTSKGYAVLEAVLGSKVLLDITHFSDLSRQDILKFYKSTGSARPLISSHTGCRALANYELNINDEWIRIVADTGGAIGVILFPFWLADDPKGKVGIDLVVANIEHLRKVGGDECVAIGTDLDGFIQPIRECENYSRIPNLISLLQTRYESDPVFLEKLLSGNARRVITTAWE